LDTRLDTPPSTLRRHPFSRIALSPKPLLLVHGEADEVLPAACSLDIHARARDPKKLILYSGCLHGLDQCQEALDRDLTRWLRDVLVPAGAHS
jgi:hypothetical protein